MGSAGPGAAPAPWRREARPACGRLAHLGAPGHERGMPFAPLLAVLPLLLLAKPGPAPSSEPLVLGETFTLQSRALGEARRINVYRPPAWGEAASAPRPVLLVLDGGVAEDLPHLAGLVQVLVANGSMRPFLVVGVENTQRRRDLTGPTTVPADLAIAPVVGGSAAFRAFLRDELRPELARRYRVTDEMALVGESLAGLFVVETFLLEPALFQTYVAVDPSLGWNDKALVRGAADRLAAWPALERTLWLAGADADGNGPVTAELAEVLHRVAPPRVRWHHQPMPEERHGTIYHPAALRAFRALFAPPPDPRPR